MLNIIKSLLILFLAIIMSPSFSDEKADDSAMQEYNKYIKNTIYNNFNSSSFKESYDVDLIFTIAKDGTCKDIEVSNTDSKTLKDALKEAVEKSAPFEKFPNDVPYDYMNVKYNFKQVTHNYYIANDQIIKNTLQDNSDYENYKDTVQTFVHNAFPTSYSWFTKNTKFKIGVKRDGTIYGVKITKSSGSARYDEKVIKKLMKTKLPPFPKSITAAKLIFSFNINKNSQYYPIIIPRF